MAADDALIGRLIAREGGYVHHPADRGGPTNMGITKRTLAEWRGRPVTVADVKALTEAEARAIYAAMYLAPFADVPGKVLRELVFDSAVLHGVGRTKRWLQEALGVTVDGVFGPKTQAALRRANVRRIRRELVRSRVRGIGRILTDTPSQSVFAAGWCNRVAAWV